MDTLLIIGAVFLIWWFFKSRKNPRSSIKNIDNYEMYLKGAEPVISIIGGHIDLLKGGEDKLPAKATDSYSLGYIAGMLDSSLEMLGQKDFESYMTTLSFTLNTLFGEKEGRKLMLKVFNLLENEDETYYQAMSDGGNEFLDFVRGQINAPMGWFGYIIDSDY